MSFMVKMNLHDIFMNSKVIPILYYNMIHFFISHISYMLCKRTSMYVYLLAILYESNHYCLLINILLKIVDYANLLIIRYFRL